MLQGWAVGKFTKTEYATLYCNDCKSLAAFLRMQTVSSYSYDMLVNWYKVMSAMVSLIWWYWNNTECKDDWLWSLFNSGIFRSYQNCVGGSFTDCCCNWEVPYLALSNPVPVCLNSRVMIGLSSFDGILQSSSGANDKFSKSDCISEMFEEGAVVGLDCLTPEWQENCNSAEVYLPELHWSCLYGEKVS